MKIPWRKAWSKLVEITLAVIRATAPDKGAAKEMDAGEAFDKWKDGRP